MGANPLPPAAAAASSGTRCPCVCFKRPNLPPQTGTQTHTCEGPLEWHFLSNSMQEILYLTVIIFITQLITENNLPGETKTWTNADDRPGLGVVAVAP